MDRLVMALFAVGLAAVPGPTVADELIREWSGRNLKTTRPFRVLGAWEVQWDAGGELFQLFVRSDGAVPMVAANQTGRGSRASYRPAGGTFYLQINALGASTVRVVAVE